MRFAAGQRVRKHNRKRPYDVTGPAGYEAVGVVRAAFLTRDGSPRYVLEIEAPDRLAGVLVFCKEHELEPFGGVT